MAITVGELALPITTTGLAEALGAIDKLDAAAAQAGARKIDIAATAGPDVAAATAQVTALNTAARTSSTQITATLRQTVAAVGTAARAEVAVVAQAARQSETSVANSLRQSLSRATSTSALMARLAAGAPRAGGAAGALAAAGGGRAVAGATLGSLPGVAGSVGGALAGGPVALGIAGVAALGATVAGVSRLVSDALPAVADFNASVRLLGATARLTNTPLSTLTATSGDLQARLQLAATTANGLTAAATRVTAAAGRTGETGRFLTAWLDLAAARSLSTSDAMALLSTNILENDEAVNRLGLSNPSVIYEKWAASMGTTAARMTDTQKAAAMMNEVIDMGGRVAGEYAARMQGAAGAQERLDNAQEKFLITLGQAIVGGTGYNDLLSAQTGIVERATGWVERHRGEIATLVGGLASLVTGLANVIDKMATLSAWFERIDRLRPSRLTLRLFGFADGSPSASAPAFTAPTGPIDSAFGAALGIGGGGGLGGFGSPFGTAGALMTGNVTGTAPRTRTGGGGARGRGAATASAPLDLVRTPEGFGGLTNILQQGERATPVVMPVRLRPLVVNETEAMRALRGRITNLADGIGNAIAGSITAGFGGAFTRAFQGGGIMASIGAGFKAMTGALLGGLGQAMVAFGQATVVAGGLMEAIKKALTGFFGLGAVAAGVAMIAIGAGLSAVASSAFGGMGRGGGGGASFSAPALSGNTSVSTTLTPRAAPVGGQQAPTGRTGTLETPRPFVFAPTIIGENDPRAQRSISNMAYQGYRRAINQGKPG